MALMSDLYTGVSGLRVSQNALNTTAHNLANVDTEGFVRQQTVLQDTQYLRLGWTSYNTLQSGLGVNTQTVRQVRDIFLDKSYRQEVGRQGFYDAQYEAITEVENLFGELQGVAFQDTIEEFWISLQELSKQPESLVVQASFIETAVTFIERSENIYGQIKGYQSDMNIRIRDTVSRINDIGDRIAVLNKKICFYESNKVENANDLRDERNLLLDELSQIVKITYKEELNGMMSVIIEGTPFVTDDYAYKMGTQTVIERFYKENSDAEPEDIPYNRNSQMLVPVWPSYDNTRVFDFSRTPSSELNTDIGGLKGLLLARGEKAANYLDIPVEPTKEEFTDFDGDFDEDEYNIAMMQFKWDTRQYNQEVSPSIIETAQAQFDQLIHGIVTMINDILCPNKEGVLLSSETVTFSNGIERTYEAGAKIYILDEENAGIGMDGPPGTQGEELFSRKSQPRYSEPVEITIEYPDGTVDTVMARIYADEDITDNYSLYSLGELTVNQALLEEPSKLPLSANAETGDYSIDKVEELISKWHEPFATLSPNTLNKNTFTEYYNTFISEFAVWGEKMVKMSENQMILVSSIDDKRLEIMGVSSDEELTHIIKYQHGYNAAARYVNVIDQMLEHLITRL